MKNAPSEAAMQVTQQLLAYWIRNPAAQGTLESIVEWWLLDQRIYETTASVRSALGLLLERKFVTEREQPDGRRSYKLNEEKLGEIQTWLASTQSGASSRKN